jgi:hypothetical protein
MLDPVGTLHLASEYPAVKSHFLRTFLQRLSLRSSLLVLSMTTAVVSLIAALGAVITFDLIEFSRVFQETLRADIEVWSDRLPGYLLVIDPKGAEAFLETVVNRPSIRAVILFNDDGHVFAKSVRADINNFVQPDPDRPEEMKGEGRWGLWKTINRNGEKLGSLYVEAELDASLAGWLRRASPYWRVIAPAIVAALAIAFSAMAKNTLCLVPHRLAPPPEP